MLVFFAQGYFGKIISTFLARRPEQTLQILHNKSVIPLLLNHLAASSILELLLKVCSETRVIHRGIPFDVCELQVVSEAEETMEPSSVDWLYQV